MGFPKKTAQLQLTNDPKLLSSCLAVAVLLTRATAAPVTVSGTETAPPADASPVQLDTLGHAGVGMTPVCSDRQTQSACLARNTKPYCESNMFHNSMGDMCKNCWCV